MAKRKTHTLPGTGDILRVELDNGLVVLARENFSSPSVVVEGVLRGGSVQETRDQAGLASFHSSLLTRGTRKHTFAELYEIIESLGASLDVDSGGHTYGFGTKSLAEDLPTMLGLLSEVFREPTFPAEYVEKVRGQIITGLQMRAHNTRSMASLTFRELAYPPDHPYAISQDGYLETIAAISRDDLVAFQRNLGPNGAVIVIVGAVEPEQAIEMVRDIFGDWRNPDQPPIFQVSGVPRLDNVQRKHVTIPGKSQSDIVLGFPGPPRSAPDFQAARLGNSILGQFGMAGRLGDSIREDQGLAYYSYSQLSGGFGPGPWQVIAGVAPENVERVVESIHHEIQRMVEESVTDEELSDNKSFFKGQLLLSLETNEGVAGSILNMEKHQLGLDYLRQYPAMIDAITAHEIQAATRNYLNPEAYALAVAGPGQ